MYIETSITEQRDGNYQLDSADNIRLTMNMPTFTHRRQYTFDHEHANVYTTQQKSTATRAYNC